MTAQSTCAGPQTHRYKIGLIVWFVLLLGALSAVLGPLTDYPAINPVVDGNVTFQRVFSHKPYRLVDPLRVNVATNNSRPYPSTLPSIAVPHTEDASKNMLASENFAWPNYFCFLLLLVLLVSDGASLLRRQHSYVRTAWMLVAVAWCACAVIRVASTREGPPAYDGSSASTAYLEALGLLAAAVGIPYSVWRLLHALTPPPMSRKQT